MATPAIFSRIENPWKQNPWFESVAEAQRRAKKRLPKGVYGALVAGSERGLTAEDNIAAFAELGFAPHTAGLANEKHMATTVMGQEISLPVIISPTGVQAVTPDGEVDVARAAASRAQAAPSSGSPHDLLVSWPASSNTNGGCTFANDNALYCELVIRYHHNRNVHCAALDCHAVLGVAPTCSPRRVPVGPNCASDSGCAGVLPQPCQHGLGG